MPLATIPVDKIETGTRLRDISEAQVETLVASIADVGLLNPITVYPRHVVNDGIMSDGYGVVAGAHRLEACRRLGLIEIEANIVGLSELERQIAECDENLCSTVLSKAERALFTKRRKEAYEALHPETRNGENQHTRVRQVGEGSAADRFTADTAAKTGQSERAVQRDAERGAKISERALAMLKGTPLDTGKYLDGLKSIDQSEQEARVKADLAVEREKRKPVSPPAAPRNDFEIINQQHKALLSAWERARPEARERFLADIGAAIDTPVMDHRFGPEVADRPFGGRAA